MSQHNRNISQSCPIPSPTPTCWTLPQGFPVAPGHLRDCAVMSGSGAGKGG